MHLVLWGNIGFPIAQPENQKTIILWKNYNHNPDHNIISIYSLIDENSDLLRSSFLDWIYSISQLRIKKKRVVDHLLVRPGFSAWWMSLLAEKCNFSKSPQIDDAIKLIAFSNWASDKAVDSLTLESNDIRLVQCLEWWCQSKGIPFFCSQKTSHNKIRLATLSFFLNFWHSLKSIIWIFSYIYRRWPLRGVGVSHWKKSEGAITFISYLFNFISSTTDGGKFFQSFYWGSLPNMLLNDKLKFNWLHFYIESNDLPNAKSAAKYLNHLNGISQGNQNHTTLDSFLSLSVILGTICDWFCLGFRALKLDIERNIPVIQGVNLWPLFANDWSNSFFGIVSMRNLLNLNILENVFSCIHKQEVGIYLQENMDWEFAMLHAWRACNHGRVIGSQHSTVRYWDLRYFSAAEGVSRHVMNHLPLPSFVAVNGKDALNKYLKGGYPEKQIIEVEALRYLYLKDFQGVAHDSFRSEQKTDYVSLLVLGEYNPVHTREQMLLLNEVAYRLPKSIVIVIKPHPACPINLNDYPNLSCTITSQSLIELMPRFDVVYTGAVSSSAVDIYCAGIKVISFQDQNTLNMSPLKGCDRIVFVKTPEELLLALNCKSKDSASIAVADEFFYLDRDLPRWKALINKSLFHLD